MEYINQALKFYMGEIIDKNLYNYLANIVKDQNLKENLSKIAKAEERHSNFWKNFLEKRGINTNLVIKEPIKIKIIKLLARVINPIYLIAVLESGENSAVKTYYQFLTNTELNHYELNSLKNIIIDELEHENYFDKYTEKLGLNNIRDLVLGMNDGLVEILGTITGLTAVYYTTPHVIGISGLVVGVAGALSMGIGAFMSVKSQKQVDSALDMKKKIISAIDPEKNYDLLRKLFHDLPDNLLESFITSLKEQKIDIGNIVSQETNNDELKSGVYTGLSYLVGAVIPVLPFFLIPNSFFALPVSLILATLIISFVATFIALVSGISIRTKIIEMISALIFAAAVSFSFGKIVQTLFGVEI